MQIEVRTRTQVLSILDSLRPGETWFSSPWRREWYVHNVAGDGYGWHDPSID